MKLTKKADPGKYRYRGYDNWFDARSQLLLSDGSCGKNVVTFGVDSSCLYMLIIKKYPSSWWRSNTSIRWGENDSRS